MIWLRTMAEMSDSSGTSTVITMRKYGWVVAALATVLAGCGGVGGGGTSSFAGSSSSGTSGTGSSSGTTTETYRLGNGTGSGFQAGVISVSSSSLSAGGTDSLTLSIVDQTGTLFTADPVTVNVSSPCISSGLATVTASGTTTAGTNPDTFTTSTGTFEIVYTAAGCSGADVITASAVVGSQSLSATGTITVAPATIGSIQFVSATPSTIGLKGTGLNENSTVIFKVVDQTGAARPGVPVTFTLNTSVGGITLTPATATTGNDGSVQTVVSSGTQHTTVRVTATIASPALSTQSSQLTVSTGLPASSAFSISVGAVNYGSGSAVTAACPNVEGYNQDGVVSPITVYLADRYNNPAPAGTAVAFTTNGGHIDGSCVTGTTAPPAGSTAAGIPTGACSVNWVSANPRPATTNDTPAERANGRVQILATAIGEESFTDLNGTGFYASGDPFQDLGEPYRDDNENGQYDPVEYFLDFNDNGHRDAPDGIFKGITCTSSNCTTTTWGIGVQLTMIMSTSQPSALTYSTPSGFTVLGPKAFGISPGNGGSITFNLRDANGNPMPAGTTVAITADSSIGTVNAPTGAYTVPCTTALGGTDFTVSFTAAMPTTTPVTGNLTIVVTSPLGLQTPSFYSVTVN